MDTPNDGMKQWLQNHLQLRIKSDHDGDQLAEMQKMEMAKMTKEMMVNAMYRNDEG